MESWRKELYANSLMHYGVKGMKWGKVHSDEYNTAYSRLTNAIDSGKSSAEINALMRAVNYAASEEERIAERNRILASQRKSQNAINSKSSTEESAESAESSGSKGRTSKGKSSRKKSSGGRGRGSSSTPKETVKQGQDILDQMLKSGLVSEVKDASGNVAGYLKTGVGRFGVAEHIKQKAAAAKAALEARLNAVSSRSSSSSIKSVRSSKASSLEEEKADLSSSKAEQERAAERERILSAQRKAQEELKAKQKAEQDAKNLADYIRKYETGSGSYSYTPKSLKNVKKKNR